MLLELADASPHGLELFAVRKFAQVRHLSKQLRDFRFFGDAQVLDEFSGRHRSVRGYSILDRPKASADDDRIVGVLGHSSLLITKPHVKSTSALPRTSYVVGRGTSGPKPLFFARLSAIRASIRPLSSSRPRLRCYDATAASLMPSPAGEPVSRLS